MSIPITACLLWKAARGNEKSFSILIERLRYNKKSGSMSVYPCEHDVPCEEATEEQLNALNKRIILALGLKK